MADVSGSSASQVARMSYSPEIILLFSGKRKSGKDYITDKLFETLGSDASVIIKISGPIKSHWAKARNLDLNQLLSDGEYKEKYRLEMIKWGEDTRKNDPGYFCRASIDMYNVILMSITPGIFYLWKPLQPLYSLLLAHGKRIWIVSDIRRKTDLKWFRDNFPQKCKSIRINCGDAVRIQRGWIFTPGVDDCETECDLDDVKDWDLTILNEGASSKELLKSLLHLIG
ncbi:phosphomevalonate kinase isoform X1 [Diachasmimorpha longicaudata]|uniref:phosphomevalonate kinase isoform X1 n=1 Tax=Diachasmimorpha longicaudata TaxID=58733 RepID=UPI0030B9125E